MDSRVFHLAFQGTSVAPCPVSYKLISTPGKRQIQIFLSLQCRSANSKKFWSTAVSWDLRALKSKDLLKVSENCVESLIWASSSLSRQVLTKTTQSFPKIGHQRGSMQHSRTRRKIWHKLTSRIFQKSTRQFLVEEKMYNSIGQIPAETQEAVPYRASRCSTELDELQPARYISRYTGIEFLSRTPCLARSTFFIVTETIIKPWLPTEMACRHHRCIGHHSRNLFGICWSWIWTTRKISTGQINFVGPNLHFHLNWFRSQNIHHLQFYVKLVKC